MLWLRLAGGRDTLVYPKADHVPAGNTVLNFRGRPSTSYGRAPGLTRQTSAQPNDLGVPPSARLAHRPERAGGEAANAPASSAASSAWLLACR